MRSLALISALAFAFSGQLRAQAPAPEGGDPALPIRVAIKRVTVVEQPTPNFVAGGVKDKRWRPKNWIEVDVELDTKLAQSIGGTRGTYPSLQVNIFLALQHSSKDGKREALEGSFTVQSIPDGESHVLAYVSPATMKAIFQKDIVTASTDIQGWGVEVIAEGKRVAGESSVGKEPWWETKKDAFAFLSGQFLHKSKTPFAMFWGDYDLPVQQQ